jgi:hypothetical protein
MQRLLNTHRDVVQQQHYIPHKQQSVHDQLEYDGHQSECDGPSNGEDAERQWENQSCRMETINGDGTRRRTLERIPRHVPRRRPWVHQTKPS